MQSINTNKIAIALAAVGLAAFSLSNRGYEPLPPINDLIASPERFLGGRYQVPASIKPESAGHYIWQVPVRGLSGGPHDIYGSRICDTYSRWVYKIGNVYGVTDEALPVGGGDFQYIKGTLKGTWSKIENPDEANPQMERQGIRMPIYVLKIESWDKASDNNSLHAEL